MTKEKKSDYNKAYRLKNKERLIAKDKNPSDARKKYLIEYRERKKDVSAEYVRTLEGKLSAYKADAKRRNKEWGLSLEEFKCFWQKDCSYCGLAIATIGLDRVDSSLGYKIDNVVSCCSVCNRMKNDSQEEEWLNKMLTILKYKGII